MKTDDLDRILLSDKQIAPSPEFMRDIMLRVQTEAVLSRKPSFPWIRFAALILIIAVPVIWFFPSHSVLRAMNLMSYSIGKWVLAPEDLALRQAFLAVLASLLGTLALVWFSLRLAGADR